MPNDRSDVHAALVEFARILARGGQLEAKLDALSSQVNRVTGSTVTIVYLLDAGSHSLLPAGAFGMSEERLWRRRRWRSTSRTTRSRGQRSTGPPSSGSGDAPAGATTALTLRGLRLLACHPLVAEEVAGDPEVQGVLAAGFESADANTVETGELLGAMADLAAVVIRDARLEQALLERSDWLDRMANTVR